MVATLSTESTASSSPSADVAEPCAGCGAPLATDQRYCLECGERRAPMSSVLLGGSPVSGDSSPSSAPPPSGPPSLPGQGASGVDGARGNAVTVIAGVGVLLLAMGVGVLIGRAGNSKPAAAPAQVISVAQPGATTGAPSTPTTTTPEASAKSGSPSSKNGSSKGAPGAGSSKGSGGSGKNAPPATPKSSSPGSGKSYEEKSKNLPNVVETK